MLRQHHLSAQSERVAPTTQPYHTTAARRDTRHSLASFFFVAVSPLLACYLLVETGSLYATPHLFSICWALFLNSLPRLLFSCYLLFYAMAAAAVVRFAGLPTAFAYYPESPPAAWFFAAPLSCPTSSADGYAT